MSKYEELLEIEAEIDSLSLEKTNLSNEIKLLENKKEEPQLKESFLELHNEEIKNYCNNFDKSIGELEKKRDLFYKSFFDECTLLSEEYKKVTAKFVDEDKKIEKEAEKIIQSSSKNFIGRYLKSLSIFFWKIKERGKIRKEAHSRFVKSHNLEEMGILMLDKPLFYLSKVKAKLYGDFIKKYKFGKKEQIVFDLYQFNKVGRIPDEVYNLLREEFLEKNKIQLLNFINSEKAKLDREIMPLNSQLKDIEERLDTLYLYKEKLKKYICPKCNGGKDSNKKYCSKCWAKLRRPTSGTRYSNPADDFLEESDRTRVCEICGANLRGRLKYCSKCRPTGRIKPFSEKEREFRDTYSAGEERKRAKHEADLEKQRIREEKKEYRREMKRSRRLERRRPKSDFEWY